MTASGAATVTGRPSIAGALPPFPVRFEGTLVLTSVVSAGFLVGPVTVSGNVTSPRNISGAVVLGAVQVSGVVSESRAISGGIVLSAVTVSGSLRTQFPGRVVVRDAPAGSVRLKILP